MGRVEMRRDVTERYKNAHSRGTEDSGGQGNVTSGKGKRGKDINMLSSFLSITTCTVSSFSSSSSSSFFSSTLSRQLIEVVLRFPVKSNTSQRSVPSVPARRGSCDRGGGDEVGRGGAGR
ncbi:hypothetical protein E2C01_045081 [Portunus trituberculatus]|uniref:Uncharacterized protein n=1 Tax=Portunus trituberculatus TaxID=210409 RepID=A0A5B7G0U7_PORTR|nr:hypothetical protein [Portunus trituberculatus]